VPEDPVTTDPWTGFLDWLETIVIPDWGGLISLLPILLILGVVGPGLTFLFLYWMYHRFTDRRGRVRLDEPTVERAPIGADGNAVFPPNAPFCPHHALVYPATEKRCGIDGEELFVRCPVDDMMRPATQDICRVCGTRYQLGASLAPVVVRRNGRPPEGGAAIA
jgi:hypothetical protein